MWKLTKISNNDSNIRTKEIIGKLGKIPKIGGTILLFSEPLDPQYDIREFASTLIKKINGNFFHTENSIYQLENLNYHLYDPLTTFYWKDELLVSILEIVEKHRGISENELIIKLINDYSVNEKYFNKFYNNKYRFPKFWIEIYKRFELIDFAFYKKQLEPNDARYFYENYYFMTIDGLIFLESLKGN